MLCEFLRLRAAGTTGGFPVSPMTGYTATLILGDEAERLRQ